MTIPRDLHIDYRGRTRPRPDSASGNVDRPFALKCGAKVAKCCGRMVWHTVAQGDCVPCSEWFGDVLRSKVERSARKEAGK